METKTYRPAQTNSSQTDQPNNPTQTVARSLKRKRSLKDRVTTMKMSLVVSGLLLLGLMMGGISARLVPSAQAKSAVSPTVTQGLTPEQIEAAVEEYFASIGSLDVQRFANNFAPNGVLEDPVGTPAVQGQQTIGAFFASIIAPFSEIKPKVQEIIPCGQEAAVNWKLNLKMASGKKITIDGMGVFKFNQAGKLVSVREFWDLAAFLEQLQS